MVQLDLIKRHILRKKCSERYEIKIVMSNLTLQDLLLKIKYLK